MAKQLQHRISLSNPDTLFCPKSVQIMKVTYNVHVHKGTSAQHTTQLRQSQKKRGKKKIQTQQTTPVKYKQTNKHKMNRTLGPTMTGFFMCTCTFVYVHVCVTVMEPRVCISLELSGVPYPSPLHVHTPVHMLHSPCVALQHGGHGPRGDTKTTALLEHTRISHTAS